MNTTQWFYWRTTHIVADGLHVLAWSCALLAAAMIAGVA